ncbi:NADAR family protein [Maribacter sp. 2307UL18-2]|uniref:NADAR family protein n=1 Tax=Maribacter sp. 2307UL18-2 TaxID=3386274 RepID=UPI0039BD483F
MKYSTSWLIQNLEKNLKIKYLFFWGHTPSKDVTISSTCLSQWWTGHPFEENGIIFQTTEHYMMAGKAKLFNDNEMLQKIIESKHPAEAKKLGRMVRDFDATEWENNRCQIVVQGNFLKFSQNAELKDFLLKTKERVIVEASPRDRIWGIGMSKNNENASEPKNWRGQNLLGFCLMEVRDRLFKK